MKRELLVVVGVAVALAVTKADSAPGSSTDGSCPVTIPTRIPPPNAGFTSAGFNFGGRYLRAHLYWPDGVLSAGVLPDGGSMATITPDGSIRVKVGWWHGLRGKLAVRGGRLDASAPAMRSDVPEGYGSRGFKPTALTFPTVGCWKVVGRLQHVRVAWVVKVRKLRPS